MIRAKVALKIILKSIKALQSEYVSLSGGLDRIVAGDIRARSNIPPFDNSAMDGYALKSIDIKGASKVKPRILRVIEDVPAGYTAKRKLRHKEAIRIMTGAPLPEGADSVLMVEFTKKNRNLVEVYKEARVGDNIRRAGEDIRRGRVVLSRGSLLRPQEIGMLASLGVDRVKVSKRARVGILATGDELIGVKERLRKGKIRNSNTFTLSAQVAKCGALAIDLGIARDRKKDVENKIARGLKKKLDILLVLGGISVGDYDLVKVVLLHLGMRMRFWRVAIRPGKPLAFGMIKGIPVFGLPGNPVSSAITFEEFVRPSILKMQGARNLFRPNVTATLMKDLKKRKELKYFIRARLKMKDGRFLASTTGPQGSGILSSLVLADGIIIAPEGVGLIKKGQTIPVQLLKAGFDLGVI